MTTLVIADLSIAERSQFEKRDRERAAALRQSDQGYRSAVSEEMLRENV